MIASQAINHGCLVVLTCFTTASNESFVTRCPAFWASQVYGKDPRTFSDIQPRLGDSPFVPGDGRDRSFLLVIKCSQIAVDCHKVSSLKVCVRSSLPAYFVGKACRVVLQTSTRAWPLC